MVDAEVDEIWGTNLNTFVEGAAEVLKNVSWSYLETDNDCWKHGLIFAEGHIQKDMLTKESVRALTED